MRASTQQRLFQVQVDTRKGPLAVGPAMLREACDQFAAAITAQIAAGKEKTWSNPTVTPVIHLEH